MSEIATYGRLGALPLQHHERDYDIELRCAMHGVRLDIRDPHLTWQIADDSRGDVIGWTLWKPAQKPGAGPHAGRPGTVPHTPPSGGGGAPAQPQRLRPMSAWMALR